MYCRSKKIWVCALTAASFALSNVGHGAFVSEIHYDNDGADTGEFVEVTLAPGESIDDFSITFYNGADQEADSTIQGSSFDEGETVGDLAFVVFSAGIQNGSPDGLSLSGPGGLIEFLSYEGTFTAADGPAAGELSMDIGVVETSSTPIGASLGLVNGVWGVLNDDSPGTVNIPEPATGALIFAALSITGGTRRR